MQLVVTGLPLPIVVWCKGAFAIRIREGWVTKSLNYTWKRGFEHLIYRMAVILSLKLFLLIIKNSFRSRYLIYILNFK